MINNICEVILSSVCSKADGGFVLWLSFVGCLLLAVFGYLGFLALQGLFHLSDRVWTTKDQSSAVILRGEWQPPQPSGGGDTVFTYPESFWIEVQLEDGKKAGVYVKREFYLSLRHMSELFVHYRIGRWTGRVYVSEVFRTA